MRHPFLCLLFASVLMVGGLSPVHAATIPDGSFDPLMLSPSLSASSAFQLLTKKVERVSSGVLAAIPVIQSPQISPSWIKRYAGRVLRSSKDAQLWYVVPGQNKRVFFDGSDASYRYFLSVIQGTIPSGKWILVKLAEQRLDQRIGTRTVAEFPISSGKPGKPTPTGEFKTLDKIPRAWSHMAGLWMPWWMEFDARGYGIHELPEWPNGYKEGAAHLGRPVSHGCVRLGVGPAKDMYDWTPVGTSVMIVAS